MSASTKRKKRYKKILDTYERYFQLQRPYKVILDHLFIQACLEEQTRIKEFLPKILHCEDAEFVVTKCIIHELWKLGQEDKNYVGGLYIAKTLKKIPCCHWEKDRHLLTSRGCIKRHLVASYRSKAPNLVVGAQDEQLRGMVRKFPGVPLLFMAGKAPVIEQLTQKTIRAKNRRIYRQANPVARELTILRALKRKRHENDEPEKKKKKKKNPRPKFIKKEDKREWKSGYQKKWNKKTPNSNSMKKKNNKKPAPKKQNEAPQKIDVAKNTPAPNKGKDVPKTDDGAKSTGNLKVTGDGSAPTKKKRKRRRRKKKKKAETPSENPT